MGKYFRKISIPLEAIIPDQLINEFLQKGMLVSLVEEELLLLKVDFKNILGTDAQFCLYLQKCPQPKSSNPSYPQRVSYSKPKRLGVGSCLFIWPGNF